MQCSCQPHIGSTHERTSCRHGNPSSVYGHASAPNRHTSSPKRYSGANRDANHCTYRHAEPDGDTADGHPSSADGYATPADGDPAQAHASSADEPSREHESLQLATRAIRTARNQQS